MNCSSSSDVGVRAQLPAPPVVLASPPTVSRSAPEALQGLTAARLAPSRIPVGISGASVAPAVRIQRRRPSQVPADLFRNDSGEMYEKTAPVLDVVGRGGGQLLPPDVRADVEARLGADFSDVRIHTDKRAAASAEAVGAAAYTVGNDIVFGTGSYSSDTDEGRRVLAHELVHVQQQRSGPVSGTDTGSGVAVSDPGDSFEREAESTASRLISPRPPSAVPGAASPRPAVQRGAASPVVQRALPVTAEVPAAEAARHLRARAFTIGGHIGFGAGQYAPGTAGGHRLLAHELAHVVQQSSGQGPAQGRTRPILQRKPVEGTEDPTDFITKGTQLINEGVGLVGSAFEMLAPVAISGSVGRGGKNHQRDVLVVSRRLGQLGYPVGSDPDSFIAAIEKYQAEVVGLDPPDGRIDPDGQTIAALRQLKGAKGSASGASAPAEHTKGGSGAGTSAHTGAGPEADYLTQNLNTYSDADTGNWEALMGTCNVTSLSMALTSLAGEDVVRSKVAALLARRGVPKGATCVIQGKRQAISQVITNPDLVKQASLPDLVAAAAIMVGPASLAWNKKLQSHAVLGQVAIDAGLATTAKEMDKPLTDPKVREAAKELLDNGSRVVGGTQGHIVDIIDVLDDGVVIHDPAGARVSLSTPAPFLYSTPKGRWESTWLSALSTDDRRDTALRRAQTNPDIRPIVERLVEISKLTDKERSAGFTELRKQLPGFIAMGARNFYDLKDLKVYEATVAFSLSAPK
jgi:Domain of unknown function (DUF4157)